MKGTAPVYLSDWLEILPYGPAATPVLIRPDGMWPARSLGMHAAHRRCWELAKLSGLSRAEDPRQTLLFWRIHSGKLAGSCLIPGCWPGTPAAHGTLKPSRTASTAQP